MNTPYYLLEEPKLRRNLQLIRHIAEAADVEFILAFKAFALWRTFPIFREYISATTASSPHEARLALEEFGAKAHTYSPAYEADTFPEIVRCSSHITFNSLSQYTRFHAEAEGVSLGLRVNPEYSEIETEIYNPCAPGSRFGVLAEDLPQRLPADIRGLHVHNHCESSAEALARSLAVVEERFSPWLTQVEWLNLGGGHLVSREGYNVALLISTLRAFHERWPHLRVILEPGSAFAWQTGTLHSSVVDIVENHGIKTAILNVSFTCHMPDCLEMPYRPAIAGAQIIASEGLCKPSEMELAPISEAQPNQEAKPQPKASDANVYRLGGNSCLSGDYMGYWRFPRPLSVGDEIVFEDMIHYTTVKTTLFNGVQHPALALRRSNGQIELLRRFDYADYRDRMD